VVVVGLCVGHLWCGPFVVRAIWASCGVGHVGQLWRGSIVAWAMWASCGVGHVGQLWRGPCGPVVALAMWASCGGTVCYRCASCHWDLSDRDEYWKGGGRSTGAVSSCWVCHCLSRAPVARLRLHAGSVLRFHGTCLPAAGRTMSAVLLPSG
jgi:hypothetical protein